VQWVELRCGHIRAGGERPCGRQLLFVAVSPERPDEILAMAGVGHVRGVSGRDEFPTLPPPPALMPNRQAAVTTGGGASLPRYDLPRLSGLEAGPDYQKRDTYRISCHPKRCRKVHPHREDRLARLALAELAAGRSTLYLY